MANHSAASIRWRHTIGLEVIATAVFRPMIKWTTSRVGRTAREVPNTATTHPKTAVITSRVFENDLATTTATTKRAVFAAGVSSEVTTTVAKIAVDR
jgi:hypothetical protein